MNLSDDQLSKVSDISADLGIVSIASVVLPALFNKSDKLALIIGVLIACLCFVFSVLFLKLK